MKREVKKKKEKAKLSIQKIFNILSATFILACCVFYGGRFIKLYLENNKSEETKMLADNIKDNNINNENFKKINSEYYFYGNNVNNYVSYSNLIWRIIKINSDNTITMTLDNSITSLAAGENKNFNESHLNSWLNNQNKEYTGILENFLNNSSKYLTYTNTCIDNIEDVKSITCNTKVKDTYITVPSMNDYINTGSNKSFMNNEEYYYLINSNNENKLWYLNSEGKVGTSDGTDIIGVKPVITTKNTIALIDGNGSIENPYKFEEETSILGSYVKLGNDTWRIYAIEEDNIKLSLDSYLTINNEEIKYKYSNSGYYHNDTKSSSLAHYLKNTYLPSLSYKDKINEVKYSNGIYNNTDNYNYINTLNTKIDTKTTVLSIGDIILNTENTNYFTSTGIAKESNLIYTIQNDFKVYTKISTGNLKIVPVISINKNLLTNGNGTKESPWEVA